MNELTAGEYLGDTLKEIGFIFGPDWDFVIVAIHKTNLNSHMVMSKPHISFDDIRKALKEIEDDPGEDVHIRR